MTIPQESIDRFLNRVVPYLPQFKHAPREQLLRTIYNCTGAYIDTKTEPRPHQLEGLAFALYLRRALLYFSPQLGKSWIGLNWAEHLKRSRLWRQGKGLVIAHSPLGLDVWETQARLHSRLRIRTVHTDFGDFCDALDSDCDLVVIPWSGLQEIFCETRKSRSGAPKLYPRLDMLDAASEYFGLCVVDEIHMAKEHTTLRFVCGSRLSQFCKFRLGLTGTPFARNPFALWSQAYLIDRGKTLGSNYYFFEAAFGKKQRNWFTGREEYKFDKQKLPLLNHKLTQLAMHYQRKECMEEVVNTGIVRLRMTGDQREAYHDALQKVIRLRSGETVEIKSLFHRLRQISSGYLPWTDDETDTRNVVHFSSNPKLAWLEELVIALNNEVPIIIFHEYIHSGELIHQMLDRNGIAHHWLYGGVPAGKSSKMVKDFQQGRVRILVSNSLKGGVSISLPQADYVCFFESPTSALIRKQAESRPAARGGRPLVIDDLVASSADEKVLEYITEGRDLMAALARELPRLLPKRQRHQT